MLAPKTFGGRGSLGAWNEAEAFLNPSARTYVEARGRRILLNATAANSLSAPTRDRPENTECNAPPIEVVIVRHPLNR
jgi:hypothetical protein